MKHGYGRVVLVSLVLAFGMAGCGPDGSETEADTAGMPEASQPENAVYIESVAWAVNVGGEEYLGIDGIAYEAEQNVRGGAVGQINKILGSQDSLLYKTYRAGDVAVSKPIANGVYDITFKFAEPDDIAIGGRVFSVLAEGQPVITDLDVRLARDGKHISALARTVTDVEVADGQLDIAFQASAGEPILNALVVRKKFTDPRTWTLAWSDEFDYQGPPDSARWNYDIWPARKVNDEDQAYTDREKNARVEDGRLIIEAHKEAYDNAAYTSARIHSQGKGDILYGRIEVRAKLPAGQGTWPAIWMLASDPFRYATTCGEDGEWQGSADCDAWPNSGEIDIMEHVGYDMNTVHGTVHNKAYYWVTWEQRKGSILAKNVDEAFHVYALEWTPEYIYVLYDGTQYFSYFNESAGWEAWPFDHPFHLILNLAVGGMWGRAGGDIDDSIFPVRMEVDYVRVYERPGMEMQR